MSESKYNSRAVTISAGQPPQPMRLLPLLTLLALAACGGGDGSQKAASAKAQAGQTTQSAEQPTMKIQAAAPASGGGVLINEVVAGNWKGARDEDGDAEDWVELHNPGTTAVDLTGYGLSKSAATPFRWTFPAGTTIAAKGHLTVWLSKKNRNNPAAALHANFDLDSGADPVILTASNATATGIPVDSATPPLLRADQAWCRMPSGVATSPFMVCDAPTRGAANAGTANAAILAKPVLSVASGFYAAAQTVAITGPAGATLRYTTDGSEPTATSAVYAAPINIAAATVLRVAAFGAGAAPSLVETGHYIVDAALAPRYAGLKAVMVALSPSDRAAYQANDQTRDFRAHFEMITGGITSVFKLDAEGSAGGQLGSGDSPQRTMNIKATDAFGPKAFPGVLWADKPGIKSSKKLRLRNGSNDWASAHLRDQLSQKMSADGPNLVASSTSVAMFINGQYYGLMDLREREEETFPAANLGVDKDFVDYLYDPLLGAQEIKNGGAAALANYQAMHNFVTGNDMTVAANYARAKTLLNPESLAWDWAIHMFHANYDWPHRNVHVWRSPEVDGRWTWHAHDMDFSFGRYTGVGYNMNGSFGAAGSQVINGLLRNSEFRNLYLNTVADQLNIMTPAYMTATLDGMAAEMRPYIADYYAKNALGPASNWETRLAELRTWFGQREPIYDSHNRTQFNLGARQPISVAVNDLAMGSVKVNSVPTQKYMTAAAPSWRGSYYPGVPITLEAQPKPGYAFVGWQGASTATDRRITQTLTAPALATPFPADNFSIRWTGSLEAPVAGTAQLQTVADDGVRLWFDGQLVIDNWVAQAATARTVNVTLVAGKRHTVVVEYFEQGGDASVQLNWQLPGAGMVPVPLERLYPQGAAASAAATGTGLTGQYFANGTLTGTPAFTRNEAINVIWGTSAPALTAAPVQLTAVFAATTAPVAPTVAAIAPQAWRTGDLVALTVAATDPGGYPVTYAAKTLPKGLNINPATGVIYGRITTPGTYNSTITATNGVTAGTLAVVWTVTDRPGTGLLGTSPDSGTVTPPPPPPANVAPTAALTAPAANASVTQGNAITVTATAADSDGSIARVEFYDGTTLIGTATAAPFSISWTNAGVGAHSLTARAIDNLGAVGNSSAVAITVVAAVPAPPANAVACATENQTCTLPAGATATVWYGATGGWAQRTGVTGSIACSNATFGDPLSGTIKSCSYVVTSAPPPNVAPTAALSAPAANAAFVQGTAITVSANAADSDGTVARVDFFDGATLIASDTTAPYSISWTTAAAGAHTLTARAVDNAGAATSSAAVAITVTAAPPPPPPPAGAGLRGQYFSNASFTGAAALVRNEAPALNVGAGAAPVTGFATSGWAVRWEGTITSAASGSHVLRTSNLADDGVRVWVNNVLVIDNWAQPAATSRTATVTLQANVALPIRVEYFDQAGAAQLALAWQLPGATVFQDVPATAFAATVIAGNGLRGQYFNNTAFTGTAGLVRNELPALNLGAGAGPVAGFGTSGWAVRWTGMLTSSTSGSHVLRASNLADDGVRVWVNNVLVIDNWAQPAATSRSAMVTLSANAAVPIRIEFYDRAASARLAMDWMVPGSTVFQAMPLTVFSPQ